MKKVWIFLGCMVLLLSFVGCTDQKLERPETNLTFWIAENVDQVDFSEYQEKYGIMGGRQYYGLGYLPTLAEDGSQVDPEACVIYTVTAYPDYSSSSKHVTCISITDPSVSVYGLTLRSATDAIRHVMADNGFQLEKTENSYGQIYRKGKFSIHFTEDCIRIRVDVTNQKGIQF